MQVCARLTKLYKNIPDSQVIAAVGQTVVEPVGTAVREVRRSPGEGGTGSAAHPLVWKQWDGVPVEAI